MHPWNDVTGCFFDRENSRQISRGISSHKGRMSGHRGKFRPLSHSMYIFYQTVVQSYKFWQLLCTYCFQVSSQKGSCSATEFCWCSEFRATFIFSPFFSLSSLFHSSIFPLVCISLSSLLPDGFRKWEEEGRRRDVKKWSVYGGQCKNCMCVRMDGGWEGGSNDWEKCSGSRFCATVILSLSLSFWASLYRTSLRHSLL